MDLGSKWINGKKMRYGYTTGSCAAAAAKAAAQMLFTGKKLSKINIATPAGIELELEVHHIRLDKNEVSCSVQKDAGDDPDVTQGLHIYAHVQELETGISIKGGQGVGIVTKKGLPVKVGQPAINPVSRQMILSEVKKVLPPNKGVSIIISIPQGEEVAKKTFNSRLGIVGGLSILGTTGIEEPMSEDSWKASLLLEVNMLAQKGCQQVIFVPGKYGEDFVQQELKLKNKPLLRISNFVEYMLDQAAALKFREILLVGDIGKFIKVAAGIFHTHSKIADARMEIMAAYAAALGGNQALIQKILSLNTTGAAIELIEKEGIEGFYLLVAEKVSQRASQHIYDKATVGTVLFSQQIGLLAIDCIGKKLLKEFY